MAGQWDAWLRDLRTAGKYAEVGRATRGLAWAEIVEIEGDWTGAIMTGGVRVAPDASSYEAQFSVSGPTISGDYSVFELSLAAGSGANSTGALPEDADADGVEEFPYAIHLQPSGGDEELLCGGVLHVLGIVG